MAGLSNIPPLPTEAGDGSLFTRIEREDQIRTLWKTVHERRLMAIKPYGLSKAEAFSMTPISLLHWLLDTMVHKKEIDGPTLGIGPGQEVDPLALSALIQTGHANIPQEGEGVEMAKSTTPPPPASVVGSNTPPPPPPGASLPPSGFSIPPPPGSAPFAVAAPEPPAPTRKKRTRRAKKPTDETDEPSLGGLQELHEKFEVLLNGVSAVDNQLAAALTRIQELDKDVNVLKTGMTILLRAIYQKQGSADLEDFLQELDIDVPS